VLREAPRAHDPVLVGTTKGYSGTGDIVMESILLIDLARGALAANRTSTAIRANVRTSISNAYKVKRFAGLNRGSNRLISNPTITIGEPKNRSMQISPKIIVAWTLGCCYGVTSYTAPAGSL
jgi:hypothetical protein